MYITLSALHCRPFLIIIIIIIINAKKCLYEGVIVPALYDAEIRGMRRAERRRVNVLEMRNTGKSDTNGLS